MQCWYFLEDPNNEKIRKSKGEITSELLSVSSVEFEPRPWLFKVKIGFPIKPSETVCLVGSVQELGNWMPEKCSILIQQKKDPDVWSSIISIPNKRKVEYRFCICIIIEPNRQVIVRSWEANITPRIIEYSADPPSFDSEPLKYGFIEEDCWINKGWLTKESTIHLKLTNNSLKLCSPKYANRAIFVKVTPIDIRQQIGEQKGKPTNQKKYSGDEFAITDVASFNTDDTSLHAQGCFGVKFENNNMILFEVTLLFPYETAFIFDFYIYSSRVYDGEPPYHVGSSYLLPVAVKNSEGIVVLPVTSTKHRPLGDILIKYVIIHPLKSLYCDMSTTFTKYWNKKRHVLDVGHRGSGKSFCKALKNCAEVRENTIASFKNAIDHGADYIEFDVHLTKDLIPVIYHDFHVCLATKKKKKLEKNDILEIPVKDLTLEQLKLLKVYYLSECELKIAKSLGDDLDEHQPFPTLCELFNVLNPYVGFNIEMKYPTPVSDGSHEVKNPQDLNLFVDKILEDTFKNCGSRRIIFSCFNPDICSAIRKKQNKYPVLFLTIGESTGWLPYGDPRCWSIKSGCQFAQIVEILGININTHELLKEPDLVNHALDRNLVIWCWGDDNADGNVIAFIKGLGIHAVTFDKIHEISNEIKESIFFTEADLLEKDYVRKKNRISLVKRSQYIELKKKSKCNDLPYQNPNFYVKDLDQEDITASLNKSIYPQPIVPHPELIQNSIDWDTIRKLLPNNISTTTSLQSFESDQINF